MDNDKTIVTTADKNFLWGVYLLIASLRYHNISVGVHVLGRGFTEADKALLTQFDNVKIFEISDRRALNLLKPEAIFTADSEYIAWIDADCIAVGDITKYLAGPGESFQIRFRLKDEVAMVYQTHYKVGDTYGSIPKAVLEIWEKDVGEKDAPVIKTTCVNNCFVLHKKHLGFIRKWQNQILKIVPKDVATIDKKSYAYHMTDESVLNSLLAFANDAPAISEYLLDKVNDAYLAHFGESLKPWNLWQKKHLKYYDLVISIIGWAQKTGYKTPPIPPSLKRENKAVFYVLAYLNDLISKIKSSIKYIILHMR